MKVKVVKGGSRGIIGRVIGVYMDGRYDIKVSNLKPNGLKYRIVKIDHCREIGR